MVFMWTEAPELPTWLQAGPGARAVMGTAELQPHVLAAAGRRPFSPGGLSQDPTSGVGALGDSPISLLLC